MTNTRYRFIKLAGAATLAGIVGSFLLPVSAQAGEAPFKGRYVNLKPTELHCTKLTDVEGHVICTYEIPGVTIRDDGEMGKRLVKGTLDYIKGEGKAQGYSVTTYADGSMTTTWWEGVSKTGDDKVRSIKGTAKCVAGTGRFAGIKCEVDWVSTTQKAGFQIGEFEGTMTLPD